MDSLPTVLVVDDDSAIVELMQDFLEHDGFRVKVAGTGEAALAVLAETPVECLLLDLMMPGQSGFDVCRQVRRRSNVPILFLSARDEDVNKIRGLGLGADDYIVKTASPAEVVARIKAVLRRSGNAGLQRGPVLFDDGRLDIDVKAREIRVDGHPVVLTPREFDILCLLAEHPRQVFTYDQLLDHFWDGIGDKHTVTVHIGRIRDKIEPDGRKPAYIVNVWGVGYRFEGRH